MRRVASLVPAAAFVLLIAVPVFGEEQGTPRDGRNADPPAPAAMGHGMSAGAMPMPDMCRQMMGDSMGMPGMSGGPADPKHHAQMLEMRGEMMKAMGDVMMKHAHRMRGMEAR
jgi:hypothetical protein